MLNHSEANPESIIISDSGSVSVYESRIEIVPREFTTIASGEEIAFNLKLSKNLQREDIILRVEGDGEDLGIISEDGIYSPPAESIDVQNIRVVAELASNPKVQSSSIGVLNPAETLFLQCIKNDQAYPLRAELHFLDEGTERLPDFAALKPVGEVCLDELALSRRDFDQGFPGLNNRFEWFALNINSVIYAPVAGSYYIAINSDDGSKVFINGNQIIDNDGIHGVRLYSVLHRFICV